MAKARRMCAQMRKEIAAINNDTKAIRAEIAKFGVLIDQQKADTAQMSRKIKAILAIQKTELEIEKAEAARIEALLETEQEERLIQEVMFIGVDSRAYHDSQE